MRILLDHCIDWKLKRYLSGHDVRSAQEMGWDRLRNGRLLTEASRQFDVFITVDRHLKDQQNLRTLPVTVIVRIAASNELSDLAPPCAGN